MGRRAAFRGVIVGQAQHHKVGHGVVALLRRRPMLQMAEKNFDADLVREQEIEIRRFRREVAHQLRLGGHVGGDQRNGPWPFVHAAAPLRRQLLARRNRVARALRPGEHSPERGISNGLLIAKCRRDEFAEMVVRLAMRGQIAPQIAARRLVHVGNFLQQRKPPATTPSIVIGPLLAAVVSAARSSPDNPCQWRPWTTHARRLKPHRSQKNCRARRIAARACAGLA